MFPLNTHIDFSRFVALGDSVTAGYKDGALFYEGQMQCYPLLLAQQFGCKFRQALMDKASVGIGSQGNSRLVLRKQPGHSAPQLSYLAAHGDISAFLENSYAEKGPFNNLGVPGAKAITLIAPGYGNKKLGEGNYNPFFSRICSSPETASMLGEAMSIHPSFFSLFIGNNDVLAYALSGGTTDAITPLEGPPGIGFEASMDFIVNILISNGAKGAISNLPSLTSIPFFTTIHYNDLVLDSVNAEALGAKFRSAGIKLAPGHNSFLVEDSSLTNGIRQMEKGELVSLDIMLDENKYNYLKGVTPIPKKYYLSNAQVKNIQAVLVSYNNIIKRIATEKKLAFVNTNQILNSMKADRVYKADSLGVKYKTGGFFSLDGLHINSLGHALLANEFIKAINQAYGTDLHKVNLTRFREHTRIKRGEDQELH
jgi:lysophospholipase L1-like esterase